MPASTPVVDARSKCGLAVIPREFSPEARELTPTLKIPRHVFEQHFEDEIEQLYGRA